MAVQIEKRLFTVEDYYKMAETGILKPTDRVELINGEIVKMSPISSQHAGHVLRINIFLNKILADLAFINIQNPIRINNYLEPEPDIAILRPATHFYIEQHPQPQDVYLIIEIADSSLKYDREVKLALYAEANIPETWIINLQKRHIEIYSSPQKGIYQIKKMIHPTDEFKLSFFTISVKGSDFIF